MTPPLHERQLWPAELNVNDAAALAIESRGGNPVPVNPVLFGNVAGS